jgi:hypothetical protein
MEDKPSYNYLLAAARKIGIISIVFRLISDITPNVYQERATIQNKFS